MAHFKRLDDLPEEHLHDDENVVVSCALGDLVFPPDEVVYVPNANAKFIEESAARARLEKVDDEDETPDEPDQPEPEKSLPAPEPEKALPKLDELAAPADKISLDVDRFEDDGGFHFRGSSR